MPTVNSHWLPEIQSTPVSFASRTSWHWTRQANHLGRGEIKSYFFRDSLLNLFCPEGREVFLSDWGDTSAFVYCVLCAPDFATGIKLPDGHEDGSLRVAKIGIGSSFVPYVSSRYRGWSTRCYQCGLWFSIHDMAVVDLPGYRAEFVASLSTGGLGPIQAGIDAKM